MDNLKNIIESLIFIAEEPVTIDHLKNVITEVKTKDIRKALQTLMEEYRNRNGGFILSEIAGGFQFRTQPEYTNWIRGFIQPKPLRLSRPALETLAIIAYKQPIIRNDIEYIRGVDCGGVLRMLLEKQLIRVLGRKEIPGRPLIYATTKLFLKVFDLKNLNDLPTPKEILELAPSPLDSDSMENSNSETNQEN